MDFCKVVSTAIFTLIALILACVLVLFISHLLQQMKIDRIKRIGLPVLPQQPLWYEFLKFIMPRDQDLHPAVKMTQWNRGVDVIHSKERIFAISIANQVFVHIFKPEYVEAITSSSTIIDKPWFYNFMEPFLGQGLLLRSGEHWKSRRKLLTPAFHFKILERFIPIFNYHCFIFIKKLQSKSDSYLDILPLASLCTLDIICETAMGVKINSQENEESEYVKALAKLKEFSSERSLYPWYWIDFIYYLTPKGKQFKKALGIVHGFTRQVIAERKRAMIEEDREENMSEEADSESVYVGTKEKLAFLDLLLRHHIKDGSISEDDIRAEVNTFMFGGHDTTAISVSWALYNLGLNADVQDKAYHEVLDIFGEDKTRYVTMDDIRKMKYLECVVKETLRLYPPVPFIGRTNSKNNKTCNRQVPAHSFFNVSIIGVHYDPEVYPNPEVFDPERFFPENSVGRHPFAYIPFSAGPRNCIGQKFAMMEEKILLSNILRHFRVQSLHPRDKILSGGQLLLHPISGLHLKFTERS